MLNEAQMHFDEHVLSLAKSAPFDEIRVSGSLLKPH